MYLNFDCNSRHSQDQSTYDSSSEGEFDTEMAQGELEYGRDLLAETIIEENKQRLEYANLKSLFDLE